MATVFYCSPTNSTTFTTCCSVAICPDQQKCPRCGEDVYPFFKGMSDQERRESAGGYCHHNTDMARHSAARRRGHR